MSETLEPPKLSKFKETRAKDVLNVPWPRHIPDRCPQCHSHMKRKVNLFHTRSRFASCLRGIAPWLSVIVLISILVFMGFAPARLVNNGGQGSPMALVGMVVGPAILLTILANCLPHVLKLHCHHCRFNKDFPKSDRRSDHHQA